MAIKITYFVHGTTTDNENDISSGWKNAELSALGIQQSKDLKEQIDINDFDVVFCSDLKRAVDSANLTFGTLVPIEIDSRLRECNYGDLNGESSTIVEPMQVDSVYTRMPNGESYEDVKKRITEFISYLKQNYQGKHIAIVAHKAPQLALEVLLNGKSWEQAFAEDWRLTKSWQPGWTYNIED